jgi:hypothetical protein
VDVPRKLEGIGVLLHENGLVAFGENRPDTQGYVPKTYYRPTNGQDRYSVLARLRLGEQLVRNAPGKRIFFEPSW